MEAVERRNGLVLFSASILLVLLASVVRNHSSGLFYTRLDLHDIPKVPTATLNDHALGLYKGWEAQRKGLGLSGLAPGVRFPSLSAPALISGTMSYEIVFLVRKGTKECRQKGCESKQGLAMAYLLESAQSLLGSFEEGGILANGVDLNMRTKDANSAMPMQCSSTPVPSSSLHLETWIDLPSLEHCQGSSVSATFCDNEQQVLICCTPGRRGDYDTSPDELFAQALDQAAVAVTSQFRATLGFPYDTPDNEDEDESEKWSHFPARASIHSTELEAWKSAASMLLRERLQSSMVALQVTLANSPESTYLAEGQGAAAAIAAGIVSFWAPQPVQQRVDRFSLLLTALRADPSSSSISISYAALVEACAVAQSLLDEPSMLPSLYFPLEQRASVYAPYWVPILAPLMKAATSVLKA